jgi:Pentapeptide repeats (8 copies)
MNIAARMLSAAAAAGTRLADRSKWPRKWWRPFPEKINLCDEDWEKQHDEISKAINKLLLILIGFCFFCVLTLSAPDRSLLASDAKIKLPFADTEISFVSFLIIAPLVLIAFSFYLHIFAGYWIMLLRQRPSPSTASAEIPHPGLPFVFNLQSRTAVWLSTFLFYWLVPSTLGIFAWKALPRPEAFVLIGLTGAFLIVFLFLQIRRRSDQRHKMSTLVLWLAFLFSIVFTPVLVFLALLGRTDLPLVRDLDLQTDLLLTRHLNLRKADLHGQELRGLNLRGADLRFADLKTANLAFTNLTGAQLIGAHLKEAHLGPRTWITRT